LPAAAKIRAKLQFKVRVDTTRGVRSILTACLAILQATGFRNAELALVDLSKFTSVSAFADAFIRDGSQIDILVYNAGVAFPHYVSTGDGWEEM
jgi:retinol dehydrogenase-12